jgi:hypothetical protein
MKNLLLEDKYDSVVRKLVRDIVSIFYHNRKGEFLLPEDIDSEETEYDFPQLESSLQIYLDLSEDDSVEGFDVEADYYREEDLINISIVSNPRFGDSIIQELVGELNEVIRHEIEHISQHEMGYKFPKKEPTNPLKYYSQAHELEAQRAGFKRRSRKEKIDYENLIRQWFENNKSKHKLSPQEVEIVVKKILSKG